MNILSHLSVTDRLGNVRHVKLNKPVFTIGRHADNDLQILGSSVSRRHAEIVREGDDFYLVDKGSKAGSYVNDQKVDRRQLAHKDRIGIGPEPEQEVQFLDLRSDEAGEEPAAAQPFNAHAELQNLAKFLEVNQALKISLSIDEVLRLIVDAAIEMTQAERGALMLRGESGELEFRVARDRRRRTLPDSSFAMSRTAVDQAFRGCRSIIASGNQDDILLEGAESVMALELRTIVCIPLQRFQMSERTDATGVHARDVLGVLYVDSRHTAGVLSKASINLLESLAFEASKALEGVRLMQQEEAKRRLEQEFAMAREVQVALLTTSDLDADQVELAAHSLPSRYVDGDFYDLFTLAGGRIVAVLGDVSGKGIAAALLAAMAQGVIQVQLNAGHPVAAAIKTLNHLLVQKSAPSKFITLFCAVLEDGGDLTFVNAGHNPPLLLRAGGGHEYLSSQSMVVGAFDFAAYSDGKTRLGRGDILVAFTDGVTEAVGTSGEMFGDERLLETVRAAADQRAAQIRDRIFEDVAAFTRGRPQDDDITVIVLKMK